MSTTSPPNRQRPDTDIRPIFEPTWAHRHVCFVTPFTGRRDHWRGLHPAYLEDPGNWLEHQARTAYAQGFEAIIPHRLSGRPDYRIGSKAMHVFNPFAEMSSQFGTDVMFGLRRSRASVNVGVYGGWIFQGRGEDQMDDFDHDDLVVEAHRLFRGLERAGVELFVHDTAGAKLDEIMLQRLHAAALEHGIRYVAEGASPEALRSGVPTFNRNIDGRGELRRKLVWNGLGGYQKFRATHPTICGASDEDSIVGMTHIAQDLGHPVWAWTPGSRAMTIAAMAMHQEHRIWHAPVYPVTGPSVGGQNEGGAGASTTPASGTDA